MSKAKPEQAEQAESAESATNESEQNQPSQEESEAQAVDERTPEISEQQRQLDDALAQAEEAKDQSLRAMAELENVRRRAQRDVEAARKFALEKMATELLGVRDSLAMGLATAQQDNGSFEALKEGTELTLRMFAGAMEKFGIEQISPEGETFNPDLHEAMTMQESGEHPSNTVLHVMQKGYQLNGRVLRPAMVVVSKRPAADADK